ncbi:MAG: response regulator [Lysobacterales bacterium]|jgi:CheY-like chemotaxis protein/glycine cleavage system H lipoate-binding protein
MVVALIVILTIVAFVVVDLVLRVLLNKARAARIQREREEALDTGLRIDVSEEAPSLRRVELDDAKARILAVDDEQIVLDSFRKILVLAGYSIDTVESGPEALGLIRSNDYDFVFTDLKMPGMDGVEVTKAVKHLRPDIDVIVITGYASIETAVETVKFGAMDYVEKPFTEDELLAFLKTALIKRQARLEKSMRHKIHLVKPGSGESRSRYEVNVPTGIFFSPQHAWARIEANGAVLVGLDDLLRKVFDRAEAVELPRQGQLISKGEALFSLRYGDYVLPVPSPISGNVMSVNAEHAEHPEWLAIKPFELSWMCTIEPSDLSGELPDMRIGQDSVEWYRQEIDRFHELAGSIKPASTEEAPEDGENDQLAEAEYVQLLDSFTRPFLPG